MPHCIIELVTQTATFRNPEFQNFHKSFLLRLLTTLMGLAGAAMGLSPKSAQDFFKEGFYFVFMEHPTATVEICGNTTHLMRKEVLS